MNVISTWALLFHIEIEAYCAGWISTDNGDWTKLIDKVVSCLHTPPCPNDKVITKSIKNIINIVWKEFNDFTIGTHIYSIWSVWFENENALSARSHIWHEMHSLPFAQENGFVTCQTTSKQLGIGAMWKWLKMESSWIWVVSPKKRELFSTCQQSLRMPVSWDVIQRMTITLIYLETMIHSESNFVLEYFYTLFIVSFIFRFDLELKNWEVDTT